MMTTTTKPLKPITPGQIKALHAIGKRRGMAHEDLRAAAGVESLKQLSVVQASALLDQLQLADHRGDYKPPPPDRKRGRGPETIRNATDRQRSYIVVLFDRLGWDDEKARRWLVRRHGIRDVASGVFSSAAATEVIVQLEQALKRDATAASGGRAEPA